MRDTPPKLESLTQILPFARSYAPTIEGHEKKWKDLEENTIVRWNKMVDRIEYLEKESVTRNICPDCMDYDDMMREME